MSKRKFYRYYKKVDINDLVDQLLPTYCYSQEFGDAKPNSHLYKAPFSDPSELQDSRDPDPGISGIFPSII